MPSEREFTAGLLRSSARAYASATLHTLHASCPSLVDTALPPTFARPIDDLEVRLLQISASVAVDRPALLQDVLGWYKVAFHHRDVPSEYLAATLQAIDDREEEVLDRLGGPGHSGIHVPPREEGRNAIQVRVEADAEGMTEIAEAGDEVVGEVIARRVGPGSLGQSALPGSGELITRGRREKGESQ